MHPIVEHKNERSLATPCLNKPIVFSNTEPFCILQDLIHEKLNDQLPEKGHFKKKRSGFFEKSTSDIIFELKTALTNVMLASELLETGLLSTEQEMLVSIILRNSRRMSDLITRFNLTSLKSTLQVEDIILVPGDRFFIKRGGIKSSL